MITSRNIGLVKIIKWSWFHIVWLLSGATIISFLYAQGYITVSIPWLPISVIGSAVAFYSGFKNNQSYDRMWEARKVWGEIVNYSRTWGMYVDGYLTNHFNKENISPNDIYDIKKRLIYRHIAWLYTLRTQLLIPTTWEHSSQSGAAGRLAKYYQDSFGIGLFSEVDEKIDCSEYIPAEEYFKLTHSANNATQIIHEQSRDLTQLREVTLIEDFRHIEMMKILSELYTCQGKCERIKKFPLPRQYTNMSRLFVGIFIILLPFCMIPELLKLGEQGGWVAAPITALIGWVYVMMEIIGDYTENPFSGMANDVPTLSLCRAIEIDLKQMLGETELPSPIEIRNNILM